MATTRVTIQITCGAWAAVPGSDGRLFQAKFRPRSCRQRQTGPVARTPRNPQLPCIQSRKSGAPYSCHPYRNRRWPCRVPGRPCIRQDRFPSSACSDIRWGTWSSPAAWPAKWARLKRSEPRE